MKNSIENEAVAAVRGARTDSTSANRLAPELTTKNSRGCCSPVLCIVERILFNF